MPLRSGKNSKQQKKHLATAQKHLCSRKNAFWRQREKTVRGGKKLVRGKEKTGRGRKKTSSRESPALQPKKLPQRKKYISATGKSSSPNNSITKFRVCMSLALSLYRYVLRPRRGLAQASPSLEAPRLHALETCDLLHQHNRKGKVVIIKTRRYKRLVSGFVFCT